MGVKDLERREPDSLQAATESNVVIENADPIIRGISERVRDATLLIVPGFGDSGPDHWQTKWEEELPNTARVRQEDWFTARKEEWVAKLNEEIRSRAGVYLVGHSLACPTIVHWAEENKEAAHTQVRGALLVAPADVDIPTEGISGFDPMPLHKLPFNSMVIASQNDPIVDIERAKMFAAKWGSPIINIGPRGHINSDSRLGNWPIGKRFLLQLMQTSR